MLGGLFLVWMVLCEGNLSFIYQGFFLTFFSSFVKGILFFIFYFWDAFIDFLELEKYRGFFFFFSLFHALFWTLFIGKIFCFFLVICLSFFQMLLWILFWRENITRYLFPFFIIYSFHTLLSTLFIGRENITQYRFFLFFIIYYSFHAFLSTFFFFFGGKISFGVRKPRWVSVHDQRVLVGRVAWGSGTPSPRALSDILYFIRS